MCCCHNTLGKGQSPVASPFAARAATSGEIRLAWSLSRSAEGFAEALEARGMTLARADADEAGRSWRNHQFAKEIGSRSGPVLKEGEIVVVTGRGDVYRIDQRTTGDLRAEIDQRLRTLDQAALLSVTDAKEVMREASRAAWIDGRQMPLDKVRPATQIETVIAGAIKSTRDGHEFAAAVDKAGITIVRASAADVLAVAALREQESFDRQSGIAHKNRHFGRLQEGEFAAVTRRGDVYRLNPYRLDLTEIEQRLADTQRRMPGVAEARATYEIAREETATLWAQRRADNTAARLARSDTYDAARELRNTTRTFERNTQETVATAHQAVDTGTRAGRGLLNGMTSMIGKALDVLADMIAPPPTPTPEQAERMERVAEERQADAVVQAELRETKEVIDQLIDEQRKRDEARYDRFTGRELAPPQQRTGNGSFDRSRTIANAMSRAGQRRSQRGNRTSLARAAEADSWRGGGPFRDG